MSRFWMVILVGLILVAGIFSPLSDARELSKSGEIFSRVQSGVVTIFNSFESGSGFLMDEQGLIVTNNHVVHEAGDDLRVHFGPHQVVKAQVLVRDAAQDLAVIRVNLSQIQHYQVLKAFTPPSGESMVLVGEKVLAIGSPLDWRNLEKVMTEGVVSKLMDGKINHDAAINPGSSGGPLLNFDGEVVGVNSFGVHDKSGPGISGAIVIDRISPLLDRAREKMKTAAIPSAELLPDISTVDYPESAVVHLANAKKAEDTKLYQLNSRYFILKFNTPPIAYRQLRAEKERLLKGREKRAKRKGFTVDEDEYTDAAVQAFYNAQKPVVTVRVIPIPKMTNGTIFRTIMVGLATGAGGGGYPMMARYEYKKDFQKMQLLNASGLPYAFPIASGRSPMTNDESTLSVNGQYWSVDSIADKSFVGVYEFDPKNFEVLGKLSLSIQTEGDPQPIVIEIPDKLKMAIQADFKPYWDYVKQVEGGSLQANPGGAKAQDLLRQIIETNQ